MRNPTTDRPTLSDGLSTVRFGEVVRNRTITEKNPLAASLTRFVALEHLDPASSSVERWGRLEDGTSFTRRFSAGNVLFGKRRAYQRKAARVDFEGVCSGDILVLEADKKYLLPALLPYLVQSDSFVRYALRTSAGSLSPRTKWKNLADFELRLPNMRRQREIAKLLDAADASERLLRSLIARSVTARLAFLLERTSVVATEQTCADVVQLARAGGTPSRTRSDFYGGGIPWLKSGEVTRDGIDHSEETITEEALSNSSAWLVPAGAVVVAMYGAGTTRGQVGTLARPMATNQAVLALIADDRVADQRFLYHWLSSRTESLRRRAAGAVQPNLSKALVLEEPFPRLDLDVQRNLSALLDHGLRIENVLEARADRTLSLRSRLREDLLGRFQGDLDV